MSTIGLKIVLISSLKSYCQLPELTGSSTAEQESSPALCVGEVLSDTEPKYCMFE